MGRFGKLSLEEDEGEGSGDRLSIPGAKPAPNGPPTMVSPGEKVEEVESNARPTLARPVVTVPAQGRERLVQFILHHRNLLSGLLFGILTASTGVAAVHHKITSDAEHALHQEINDFYDPENLKRTLQEIIDQLKKNPAAVQNQTQKQIMAYVEPSDKIDIPFFNVGYPTFPANEKSYQYHQNVASTLQSDKFFVRMINDREGELIIHPSNSPCKNSERICRDGTWGKDQDVSLGYKLLFQLGENNVVQKLTMVPLEVASHSNAALLTREYVLPDGLRSMEIEDQDILGKVEALIRLGNQSL